MPRTAGVQVFPGNIKALGDVEAAEMLKTGVATGFVAGTTQTQAGATALPQVGHIVIATSANAGDVVKLPVADRAGRRLILTNDGANTIEIFPSTDGTINGGSADAAEAADLAAAKSRLYISSSALNWERVIME